MEAIVFHNTVLTDDGGPWCAASFKSTHDSGVFFKSVLPLHSCSKLSHPRSSSLYLREAIGSVKYND